MKEKKRKVNMFTRKHSKFCKTLPTHAQEGTGRAWHFPSKFAVKVAKK